MSLEQVFLRFSRIASLPVLVISLLFCYFSLPDNVAIHHNDFGKPDNFVSKETFYYVMVAIILAFNVVMTVFKNAFMKLPNSAFPPQKPWTKNREALNLLVESWINLFVTIINVFLIISIIALNRINKNEGQVLDINYNWVLVLGGVLLMIIIFYLPLKLLYTKPEIEA